MVKAYITIHADAKPLGRLDLVLHDQDVPKTVKNFCHFLKHKEGYLNSKFHRIIRGFMAQGGDFLNGDGTGSTSIYGKQFADEAFVHSHDRPGVLSMANSGKDTNGSQFFITFRPTPHLDGKHVVFGYVDLSSGESQSVLKALEGVRTGTGDRPTAEIKIVECGVIEDHAPTSNQDDDDNEIDLEEEAPADETSKEDKEPAVDKNQEELEELESAEPPKTKAEALKLRMRKLKLKMNQARELNKQEVLREGERLGSAEGAAKARKRQMMKDEKANDEAWKARNVKALEVAAEHGVEGKHMVEQADASLKKAYKKDAKAKANKFEMHDYYNPEGQHRNYERNLKSLTRAAAPLEQSEEELTGVFNPMSNTSNEEREREGARNLANEMKRRIEKQVKNKRNRLEFEQEDVSYINQRNKRFNQKIARNFDKHTAEIRQNLEQIVTEKMATGNEDQQGGTGLGQSTPLVTIPGPSTIYRGVVVPAGDDHPLAPTAVVAQEVEPVHTNPPVLPAPPGNTQGGVSLAQATPVNVFGSNAAIPSQVHTQAAPTTPSAHLKVVSAAVSPPKTIDAMADTFLSESSYRTEQLGLPPLLRPTPLPREEGIHRLRTLVERRAWGDVLKMSTTMLNAPKSLHADVYASLVMLPLNAPKIDVSHVSTEIRNETVEIMTLQCHAWLKLRRYGDLATEVERWNFVTINDATAQSPDWLPWGLHILAGQTLQYTTETDRASDVMFEIREHIPKEQALWIISADNALANMFIKQGRWRLALGSYDRIMEQIPAATSAYVRSRFPNSSSLGDLEKVLTAAYKCEILSRQGRTLLQVGALPQVADIFELAKQVWGEASTSVPSEIVDYHSVKLTPINMKINEGLFYFAKSNFEHALEAFSRAVEMLREGGIPSLKYNTDDWLGLLVVAHESPSVIYSECINNMSLCNLYTCRMKEAVSLLEGVIREDPTAYLTERVATTLCALYELGADSATSAKRKRVLQLIAKRFFLHDVGPESFRVT